MRNISASANKRFVYDYEHITAQRDLFTPRSKFMDRHKYRDKYIYLVYSYIEKDTNDAFRVDFILFRKVEVENYDPCL